MMAIALVLSTLGYAAIPALLSAQPSLLQRSSFALASGAVSQSSAATLAFTGVTVIDVTDGRRLPDQTVVIAGTRVREVGPVSKVRVPAGAQIVDAKGKYIIPGLWDMHVHVKTPGAPPPSEREGPFHSAFIAHGVTGIRELGQRFSGGADSFHLWQREIAAGIRVGPRAIGPSIDLTDGIENQVSIKTPEDARRIVDSLKAAGMVFLKYHADGGDPALYFAMLREARRVGLPFVGHVPQAVTETEAADSGQRSIEHISEHHRCWPALEQSDSVLIDEQCGPAAAAYIRNGTWLTPTLVTYHHYNMLPAAINQSFVRVMRRFGVTYFLTGSDTGPIHRRRRGIWPGVSLLEELVFLAQAGLSPVEVLQAATLNPAKFLNATDSLGTVAPNKLADLVLLDADPLDDISNAMKIRAVVANGRYFDRATLDALDPEGIQLGAVFAQQLLRSAAAPGSDP